MTCVLFQLQLSNSRWLRASHVWWIGSVHLLSAAEDQARFFVASCGAVGWLCVAKSLQISSNCWWGVSGQDTSVSSSQQLSYLKREFQRDPRRFLEEITTFVLSTVAARSKIGQGLSCFCPAIIIGGDDHGPLHLLDLLLDGLLDRGWVKGSEIEACRSEYQSFVQEQWQLERSSTRSRPRDVLSFCSSQAGFCARQHLFKVCIVTNMVKLLDRYVGEHWSCFSRFSS